MQRYLWATGRGVTQVAAGSLVAGRYAVIGSQIWLDTQPSLPPAGSELRAPQVLPYLRLHPHRLHLPGLFSCFDLTPQLANSPSILLLENAPITPTGQLQPRLEAAWSSASALRQLNWLWQIWQLWQPLKAQGVASSLLIPENLHVEGWRLRLRELVADQSAELNEFDHTFANQAAIDPVNRSDHAMNAVLVSAWAESEHLPQTTVLAPAAAVLTKPLTSLLFNGRDLPMLHDLGEVWQAWVATAHPTIQSALRDLCTAIKSTADTATGAQSIANQLNQLLLEQSAILPLHIDIAAATTVGTQRSHNEDACYPLSPQADLPRLAMVCDGIGGHEGGEVASQLALRSMQLQLRTWLTELATQAEPLSPQIIADQLAGMVRVVNNLIAAQNNQQKREQRQRMGTTLMMAVQLPQSLSTDQGRGNTHELYLVHVGDSRAYWLSATGCQQLTVDDDVAHREVRSGRSLYSQVLDRPDAAALTQALGTREANGLKITVQRFILDHDGVLLLCSDGLSDNALVEQHWQTVMQPVLENRLTLQTAAQTWIDLANRHNGHDNASLVLMHCQLKTVFSAPALLTETADSAQLTESARVLLYEEQNASDLPRKAAVLPKFKPVAQSAIDGWVVAIGVGALMFVLGALGVAIWRELAPTGFRPEHPSNSTPNPAHVEGQD